MKKLFAFLLCSSSLSIYAQTIYIGNHFYPISQYQIVVPRSPTVTERKAATELQKYLGLISGTRLNIVTEDAKIKPGEFVIGNNFGRTADSDTMIPDKDEFIIKTIGQKIFFNGGSHKGTLYGVYEFLERYAGCRFFYPGAESVPSTKVLKIPVINRHEKPAFGFREVYYRGMTDTSFADKMRCDSHGWEQGGEWGMWVHTLFTLVPPEKYFDSHPEYYALMSGQRSRTQLCLTNPRVLKIVIEELGTRMKEKPGAKYWSVSQMDTYGNCECTACKKVNEREGSPSGLFVEFVNKVAAAFPEKVISTLAYQFTRKAPAYIKPASNVNIVLCTIECDRNKPLDADTSKGSFYNDLKNWSGISDDILVWDYVIQFSNMISPFPNLHVLQPNIRLLRKSGVRGVFEQGCRGSYSENQELREYILAKLLWNPDINVDSLITDFTNGYYGAAAPFIRQYISGLEKNQVESGRDLLIYGSPVQETGSFLGKEMIGSYNELFDRAEDTVKSDTLLLSRVKKLRLPLNFAMIEIARKNITGPEGYLEKKNGKWEVRTDFINRLDTFARQANRYQVTSIHERGWPPDRYKEDVRNSIKNSFSEHLAFNKPYVLKNQPSPGYPGDGPGSLTDGKRGFMNYHILWQGFEGEDFEITIDFGEPAEYRYIGIGFLQDIASWIFLPVYVEFYSSDDGIHFTKIITVANTESAKEKEPLIRTFEYSSYFTQSRHIKIFAKSLITCPGWHIGHGGKAWLFTDEVVVN